MKARGWTIRDRALAWVNLSALFVLALGVVVLANFNAERKFRRFDMTEAKSYSLHPETENLIRHRVNRRLEIRIVGVQFTQDASVYTALDLLSRLLGEFKRLNAEHIEVIAVPANVDDEERARIEQLFGERLAEGHVYLTTYRRTTTEGVEEDPVVETLPLMEMFQGDPMTGKVLQFFGEQMLANTINKMFTDRPHVVYVTRGHGELSREATRAPFDSFQMTAQILEQRMHVEWRDLDAPITEVPSDAEVVLVARPYADFLEMELTAIRKYLEGGGRLFVAAARASSLTESLRDFDVELTGEWLLTQETPERTGIPIQLLAHETNGLKSVQGQPTTGWNQITEVGPVPREERRRPLFEVVPTIQTYFQVKPFDFDSVASAPNPQLIPYGPGPGERLPVAAVGEGPLVEGGKEARLVVWGSALGLWGAQYDPYQLQLLTNTFNWMWGQEDLIVPPPVVSDQRPLVLDGEQSNHILIIAVAVMPSVALLLGFGLWIVRRR